MTMTDTSRLAQWVGGTLVDDSGDKIDTFYVDEQTDQPSGSRWPPASSAPA